MFTQKEKLNIYCGLNVLITGLLLGIMPISRVLLGLSGGILILVLGTTIVFLINSKKYGIVKNLKIVTFTRAVIIDSICLTLYLIGCWCCVFVPFPFSIGEFLHPDRNVFVFPFYYAILGLVFVIPLIRTNKRILNFVI